MDWRVLGLLLLAGCGDGSNPDTPMIEWSGRVTEQSDQFILSYDRSVIEGPMMEDILRWWKTTQFCVGVEIDILVPIVIEYTPIKDIPNNKQGWNVGADGYIRVYDQDDGLITLHELTHQLLYEIGVNKEYNDDHGGFHRCFGEGTF